MSGIALLLLDARMTRASPGGEGHPRDVDNAGSRAVHQSCEGIIVMLKQKSSEYRGYRTAGIRLKDLTPRLAKDKLAMMNLGSIREQSIAGAISTGTHASTGYTDQAQSFC